MTASVTIYSNILPQEILNSPTPSARHGVDSETELSHRIFGCQLIQEGGILLELPQVAMVTAQNILNRFYYRKSLKRYDVFSIAMGCLMLASKIEEKLRNIREVLFVFHRIFQRRKGLKITRIDLGGQLYSRWKTELIMVERVILKELGFSLYNIMDHPHKYILYYIKMLFQEKDAHNIAQTAWNYINDSMRLDLSLRYEAKEIASAAIFLASRMKAFPLPENPSWWDVVGVSYDTLVDISTNILALYDREKIIWLEPLSDGEYLDSKYTAQKNEEENEVKVMRNVTSIESFASIGDDPSKTQVNAGEAAENVRVEVGNDRESGNRKKKDRKSDRSPRKRSRSHDRERDRFRDRSRDKHRRRNSRTPDRDKRRRRSSSRDRNRSRR